VPSRRGSSHLPRKTQEEFARGRQVALDWEAHVRGRFERFHQEVQKLTDMKSRGGQVAQLELCYPGRLLPRSLVVIDTPGVNADDQTNRGRAWDVIRGEADGCIVLSDIQQAAIQERQRHEEKSKQVLEELGKARTDLMAQAKALAELKREIEQP
jgi:hypothetical protein